MSNTYLPGQTGQTPPFPDFEPQIPGVLESAPAYAHLVTVKAAPLLVGCVYSITKDKCSCYTQQATPYPASKAYCLESVKNHRFNPYLERPAPQTVETNNDVLPLRKADGTG